MNPVSIGNATLYCGDCLDVLPELNNIESVITDPPFFVPVQHYVQARGSELKKNFGDLSVLKHFFKQIFKSFGEILDKNGSIYCFCDGQSYPLVFEGMYPIVKRVRPLIWDKLTSYNGYTWRHQHEIIAWGEMPDAEQIPTGDGDILKCRAVPVGERLHPAEKPVELIKLLINKLKIESNILDPFMGSGSTGVAALQAGRKFIGIETDERYFEIACKRIQKANDQGDFITEQPALLTQAELV